MTENVALAARMTELGIGAHQLARALAISERTVGYWLSGKITWPNEPTRSKAVHLLKVKNPRDLGFIPPVRRYLGHERYELPSVPECGWIEEAATNRRDALRTGGVAVAGLVAHQVLSEPDHMTATLDAGSISRERLADLERRTDRLADGAVTTGKSALLGEAMGAFTTVRTLVREPQRTADRTRLIRLGAKLAMVASEILFDGHQFQLADRWYRTAHRTARDIADSRLVDIAVARWAYLPAYSGDPRGVLAMIGPRLERTPAPSAAVAFLWGAKARAHATLGERSGFQYAIDRSQSVLDAVPVEPRKPAMFVGFNTKRLAFYRTTGYVKLRDPAGATRSADQALALYDGVSASESAMVRLDKASALVLGGSLDEACRLAAETLADQNTPPVASVLIRAGEFDRMLDGDAAAGVRDWRDVLHAARQRAGLTAVPT